MSTQTRGPERLPRPPGRPEARAAARPVSRLPRAPRSGGGRARDVLGALVAGIGLLALLAGLPAALVLAVGNPLPTTLPNRDWLVTEVSTGVLIKVLAVVVWLLWAHFALCVAAEWRAVRRHRLPPSVPLGGGSQLLARKLVVALLLVSSAATVAPAALATPVATTVATAAVAAEPAMTPTAQLTNRPAPVPEAVTKSYQVAPPHGRHHDCLWDIAERTLGDPLRYKEIYELNRHRVQPDGRRLVDADLIHPGWVLIMPADAHGAGITVSERIAPPAARGAGGGETSGGETSGGQAPGQAQAPAQTQAPAVPEPSVAQPETAATAAPEPPAAEPEPAADPKPSTAPPVSTAPRPTVDAEHTPAGNSPPAATEDGSGLAAQLASAVDTRPVLVGGGLLLAGVLVALAVRRGPFGRPDSRDTQLRLAADPRRAELLDRALRQLAAARAEQDLPMPEVLLAFVAPEEVVIHLAMPAEAPPEPWTVEVNGRSWAVRAAALDAELDAGQGGRHAPDVPAPYPALATIASVAGYEVLVDLEAAPGLVALGGDPLVAREVVASLAVELATNLWSDSVRVTLVGFGDDLSALSPGTVRQVDRLEEVLAEVETAGRQHAELLSSLGIDGVLSGRAATGARAWTPHVLLLSGPPTDAEADRIQRLAGNGRTAVAVVCVGDSTAARWRFVVSAEGTVELGTLGIYGQARRLPREEYAAVLELLHEADDSRRRLSAEAEHAHPREAARAEAELATPLVRHPVQRTGSAPVEVRLLGPVQVEVSPDASGTAPVDAARLPLLSEVVVAAALHRGGLHEAALRSMIWPRGVGDDVLAFTLADVQSWLGRDGAGRPRMYRGDDGRWLLSPDVRTDWDLFRLLAAEADGDGEYQTLWQALTLGRGGLFSDVPAGRYGWLEFNRAAREARVLATQVSRRTAALAVSNRRPAEAWQALNRGLAMVPTAEALWRDLLKLVSVDPPVAQAAATDMYAVLRQHGIHRPEPETDAMVDAVAPGLRHHTA